MRYHTAIRCWLWLDTSSRSMCPFCTDTALDPLAVTYLYSHGRMWPYAKNDCEMSSLTPVIVPTLALLWSLTRDVDHTTPTDIYIAGWDTSSSHHHSDLPSWVNHVARLVQQPLLQWLASSTPMDPNTRIWVGPAFH